MSLPSPVEDDGKAEEDGHYFVIGNMPDDHVPNHHQHDDACRQGRTPHPAIGPLDRVILGNVNIDNHFVANIGNRLPEDLHIYIPGKGNHRLPRGEIDRGLFHSLNLPEGPLDAGRTGCAGHPPDGEGHLQRSPFFDFVAGIGHRGLDGVFIDHPRIIIHISLFRGEIDLGLVNARQLTEGPGQPLGAACAAHAFDVEGDALSVFHVQTSLRYNPYIPLPCRGICNSSILPSRRPVNNYSRRALDGTFLRQGKALCIRQLERGFWRTNAKAQGISLGEAGLPKSTNTFTSAADTPADRSPPRSRSAAPPPWQRGSP